MIHYYIGFRDDKFSKPRASGDDPLTSHMPSSTGS